MVTMKKRLDEKEIKEVFETLRIPITEKEPKTFEVWEVPPIKKGARIFTETH